MSRGSTRLRCAKTAEQYKILFRVNTLGNQRNIVLDGGHDPPPREGGFDAAFAKLLWPLVQLGSVGLYFTVTVRAGFIPSGAPVQKKCGGP